MGRMQATGVYLTLAAAFAWPYVLLSLAVRFVAG